MAKSLRRSFLKSLMISAGLAVSLLFLFWAASEMYRFAHDAAAIRTTYEQQQREQLRQSVSDLAGQIQYRIQQTDNEVRKIVKERVLEAHAVALHIIHQNQGTPRKKIEQLIKDALRPLRYNQGRGYYFIFNQNGIEELFAAHPEMEGQNMLALQDTNGQFVVRDMLELVNRQQEGYYRYTWTKPGESGNSFTKIAYVKLLEPIGWVIGTGEYVDDVRDTIQQELLERIVTLRFGRDGYFFGSIEGGLPLFTNGQITRGSGSIWELTDPLGLKITQEYQRAAMQNDGGFVHYSWPRLHEEQPVRKLSYVLRIPQWHWIIGAGVYLDEIESHIAEKKRELLAGVTQKVLLFLLVPLSLMLSIFFLARRMAASLDQEVRTFKEFFQAAAEGSGVLQPQAFQLQEFRDIASTASGVLQAKMQADLSVKESARHHRIMFEKSPLGMVLLDSDGTVISCNDKLLEITGSTRERIVGRPKDNYSSTRIRQAINKAIGGETALFEGLYTSQDNQISREFRALLNPLYPGHPPTGVIAIVEDITGIRHAERERKNLETQLQQAQKMEAIGTLAGGIAHDFNNILGAIIGYAEMAREDCPPDSAIASDLDQILQSGSRARDLVKQILAFSRQAETVLTPLLPAPLLKEAVKMLRASLPSTIGIEVEIEEMAGPILADPTQFHQIVMNLCTNAFHAMEESGGQLAISLKQVLLGKNSATDSRRGRQAGYVVLAVSDTGSGIDPEVQKRMFDPFFTTKEPGKGTGMGLSTVLGIVQSYGGWISCDSKAGQGTTFRIYLPAQTGLTSPLEDASLQLPLGQEHLLFVDDDAVLADMQRTSLERLGYRVTVKTSGAEALAAFRQQPDSFAAVITDQTMPGMTGAELARHLLQLRPDLPIMLCTGFSAIITEEKARAIGIREFAMKPLSRADLANALRRLLTPAQNTA